MNISKNDRLLYICLLIIVIFIQLALLPDYRSSKLVYYGFTLGNLAILAFAIIGLSSGRPVTKLSRKVRVLGALPLMAGALFLGFWVLLIVSFVIFHR